METYSIKLYSLFMHTVRMLKSQEVGHTLVELVISVVDVVRQIYNGLVWIHDALDSFKTFHTIVYFFYV